MRRKYDPDGFAAIKGILIGLFFSFIMVATAGFALKLMWRMFMLGWGIV